MQQLTQPGHDVGELAALVSRLAGGADVSHLRMEQLLTVLHAVIEHWRETVAKKFLRHRPGGPGGDGGGGEEFDVWELHAAVLMALPGLHPREAWAMRLDEAVGYLASPRRLRPAGESDARSRAAGVAGRRGRPHVAVARRRRADGDQTRWTACGRSWRAARESESEF